MLVGVAFVPGPPIVVPEVSVAAAEETAPLRAAGDAAVVGLVSAGASRLVIVGIADQPGAPAGPLPADATGDLRGFGVDLAVALDPSRPDGPRLLPRALVLGAWWCDRAAPGVAREAWVLAEDLEPDGCAALGARIASAPGEVGLVVVGDGSATRTEQAPGHVDADGGPFDAEVAAALAAVDLAGLLGLDPDRARRLMAEGRAPWQLAAGAVRGGGGPPAGWRGEVTYDEAPYGVGYLVASWRRG